MLTKLEGIALFRRTRRRYWVRGVLLIFGTFGVLVGFITGNFALAVIPILLGNWFELVWIRGVLHDIRSLQTDRWNREIFQNQPQVTPLTDWDISYRD